jgi:hypothetical protein
MYGLKQAGLLANQLLQKRLEPYGYYPASHTPGLWLHKSRPIAFTLIVDDFAVIYGGQENAHHLRNALLHNYEITTDWGGNVYSGMTLNWDYQKRTCDISMPGYVTTVLDKFQHATPKQPQDTPSKYMTPSYGAKTQYAARDETPLLSAKQCTNIQKITGSVLYYTRAVDPTVFTPLNDIATEQTKATEKTQSAAKLNGSILNAASVIKNVVVSAAESEVGACFQNAQSGASLRVTLAELGHTQLATPLRTDNSTDFGILNETIKQKRSKAMDMRYHWLTDRVRQKQFDVYWRPGKDNLGYYHTKHHSAQHHKDMRQFILHQANILNILRGCVKLPQPQLRTRTYTQTGHGTLRATQVRAALSYAYSVTYQNRITDKP